MVSIQIGTNINYYSAIYGRTEMQQNVSPNKHFNI